MKCYKTPAWAWPRMTAAADSRRCSQAAQMLAPAPGLAAPAVSDTWMSFTCARTREKES